MTSGCQIKKRAEVKREENLVVMMIIVYFETLTGVIEWNYWYELHSRKYRTLIYLKKEQRP